LPTTKATYVQLAAQLRFSL